MEAVFCRLVTTGKSSKRDGSSGDIHPLSQCARVRRLVARYGPKNLIKITSMAACFGMFSISPALSAMSTNIPFDHGAVDTITPPPANLGLSHYYAKYIDANGIPIVANKDVDDSALIKMKTIVVTMTSKDSATRNELIKNLKAVLIIPANNGMTSLPEYSQLDRTNPLPNGEKWDNRAEGVSWTAAIPYVSCDEADLRNLGYPRDRYPDQSICIHEFAHAVWDAGVVFRDPNAEGRLKKLYSNAKSSGYLRTSYAGINFSEYWAEGVQAWFNAASCTNKADTTICTNDALWASDPGLWKEIGHWFERPPTTGSDRWR